MQAYTTTFIAKILAAELVSNSADTPIIKYLLHDSRQLQAASETLFFAIVGDRNDGHQYIEDLYAKGVRAFVVSDKTAIVENDAHYILVENTVQALQHLATFHRQQFDLEVIGITGSNGKTIVKEWLFQLLSTKQKVVRSPKSYNSQIGVPLSVWNTDSTHELGIFEAGISRKKEMQQLAPIINCDIGIFTNIGSAHDEGFASRKEKIMEKLQLFPKHTRLIYCRDYPLLHQCVQEAGFKKNLDWSVEDESATIYISKVNSKGQHTQLQAQYGRKSVHIQIPFTNPASIENAIHCWVYLLYKKWKDTLIWKGMLQLEPVAMRLELKTGIHDTILINDSYNSDLESLRIALHFMQQQGKRKQNCLILSDILQTGLSPDTLYQKVGQFLNESPLDSLIGIGSDIHQMQVFLRPNFKACFYETTLDFLQKINPIEFQHQTILIKGARQFGFEKITNRLAQKVHQTVLEVNLSALSHNLQQYTQRLEPQTKVMVMVKAAAYGSGSFEVARLLESKQVDYLGVAYADEGVELRKAGIQTPILVLNSEAAVFDTMLAHQLEPEIYSLAQLNAFLEALPTYKGMQDTTGINPYPIHLNLDTGMNRLGFETQALDLLIDTLQKNTNKIRVKSIFSHLAASESSKHDAFSKRQIQQFLTNCNTIVEQIGYRPWQHLLNSSGILRFPQYQLDMVRLGIGLYGIDSSKKMQGHLQVVNSLKASISQIKTVQKKETVGYGRAGKLPQTGRIATISIGYADGLLRQAGKGNYSVYVHGERAPIVGNVCMDMCMIDVTHIRQAQEGDEVEIFGNNVSVTQLADCLGTIPYEVFTSISNRVQRVYFQE